MTSTQITSNPFAQMMDPHAVMAAVERSERLRALQSRVCRPLDRPLVPTEATDATDDAASFDASVEAAGETEPAGGDDAVAL